MRAEGMQHCWCRLVVRVNMDWWMLACRRWDWSWGLLPSISGHGEECSGWQYGQQCIWRYIAGNVWDPRLHSLHTGQGCHVCS